MVTLTNRTALIVLVLATVLPLPTEVRCCVMSHVYKSWSRLRW